MDTSLTGMNQRCQPAMKPESDQVNVLTLVLRLGLTLRYQNNPKGPKIPLQMIMTDGPKPNWGGRAAPQERK